jgi:hypothetical protein
MKIVALKYERLYEKSLLKHNILIKNLFSGNTKRGIGGDSG